MAEIIGIYINMSIQVIKATYVAHKHLLEKDLSKLRGVIIPVLFNIFFSLFAWVEVYEMETDPMLIPAYYLDPTSNFTTGCLFYDGLLNGLTSTVLIAVVSFAMLALALYDYRRIVQFWLRFTCIIILYTMSANFSYDFLRKFTPLNANVCLAMAAVICLIYGTVGVYAFFYSAPNTLHQFYVCCNCSFISLFYVRSFPGQTAWFVLGCVVLWDIFAVLNFYGPLRKVQEKAGDYSANLLRLLMFSDGRKEENEIQHQHEKNVELTADETESDESEMDTGLGGSENGDTASVTESNEEREEAGRNADKQAGDRTNDETESSGVSTDTTSNSEGASTCNEIERQEKSETVADALQDSTMRLGLGDFVFYSLLVCKAATNGSTIATFNAIIGVLYGLIITLTTDSFGDVTTPALPLSVAFGTLFHFATLGYIHILIYWLKPFLIHIPHFEL